jgi:ribonuclease HI
MKIWTDGSVRGNPGKAAWAFVAKWNGMSYETGQRFSDLSTNNVAEYMALIKALEWLMYTQLDGWLGATTIYCDSKLIVEQVNGNWKVKHAEMKPLHEKATRLMNETGARLVQIPRSQNTEADALVNKVQDAQDSK